MASKRSYLAALVGIVALAASLAPRVASAHVANRPAATARPDLALTADDLPPGSRESAPNILTLGGEPLEDRLLIRQGATIGPLVVWSTSFEAPESANAAYVQRNARTVASLLADSFGDDVVLSDWAELDASGIGEAAALLSFRYEEPSEGFGADGALVMFARDGVIGAVMVLSIDGRCTVDVYRLARLMDSRVQQQALARVR